MRSSRPAVWMVLALPLLLASCGGTAPVSWGLVAAHASVSAAAPDAQQTPAAAPEGSGSQSATAEKPEAKAAKAWKMPVPDLGYNAREGRALFSYYCTTCHGAEGHGDGFNAYNLDPKPRDLSDAAFQKKRSDDDLAAVIRSGGGVAGLSTGMPPWGRTLNDREIRDIVRYIRTLVAKSP